MSKNLILSLATGYAVEHIKNFVISARKYYSGRICLFIDSQSTEMLEFLQKNSIEYFIANSPVSIFQIGVLRWQLCRDLLINHYPDIQNVLATDSRDVVFQDDPFKFLSGSPIDFSCEVKRIQECGMNTHWVKSIYGDVEFEAIKDQIIINGGVVAGTRDGIIYLCNQIEAEAMAAEKPTSPYFVDQASINVLYRRGRFPNSKLNLTGESLFATVGHAHHCTLDREGYLLGNNLQKVSTIHQYDRFAMLSTLFDKNIRPKKQKIIDCFTFFDELDLLEGRLEYLYDVVDYFVIVEADITHSAHPKPFNYTANIARFKKYQKKIIYLPVSIPISDFEWDNSPEKMAAQTSTFWKIEQYQRNCIKLVLNLFDEGDTVIISDLDEIPRRENVILFSQYLETTPTVGLEQRMKVCNLGEQPGLWVGPVMTRIKTIVGERDPQWFRQNRYDFPRVAGGGWHLTWWGGAEKAMTKIKNMAHQEVNTPNNADISRIKERMSQNKHPVDELAVHYDCPPEGPLPEDFVEIFSKYIK